MAIDLVLASLSRVPLFAGLEPVQITEIGRRAERCAFRRGEIIAKAGEAGNSAYLILAGEVGCRADDGGPEAPVEPGSLVGELAMLVDHTYGVTAVARGWVDCLKLSRDMLSDVMRTDPDIAERIADVIRGRLTFLAEELRAIDRLLTGSIERYGQVPLALPPPSEPATLAAGMAH
jgi:CRP-like cAMP-binding protein